MSKKEKVKQFLRQQKINKSKIPIKKSIKKTKTIKKDGQPECFGAYKDHTKNCFVCNFNIACANAQKKLLKSIGAYKPKEKRKKIKITSAIDDIKIPNDFDIGDYIFVDIEKYKAVGYRIPNITKTTKDEANFMITRIVYDLDTDKVMGGDRIVRKMTIEIEALGVNGNEQELEFSYVPSGHKKESDWAVKVIREEVPYYE